MLVKWTNYRGDNCFSLYWSVKLTLQDFEQYIDKCDILEVIYPFSYESEINDKYGSLLYYVENEGRWNEDVITGCINLKHTENMIFDKIVKNKRYEIRRARERDNLSISFFEDINEPLFEEYRAFYKMYEDRGLYFSEEKIKALVENNNFIIGKASKDGETLVVQGYLIDQQSRVVMLYSNYTSTKHHEEIGQLLGRANALLLYESMLFFKARGFKIYDSGGMPTASNDKKLRSIAEYKKKFGFKEESRKAGFVFFSREYKNVIEKIKEIRDIENVNKIVIWGSEGKFGRFITSKVNCLTQDIVCIDKSVNNTQLIEECETEDSVLLVCIKKDNFNEITNIPKCKEYISKKRLFWMRDYDQEKR